MSEYYKDGYVDTDNNNLGDSQYEVEEQDSILGASGFVDAPLPETEGNRVDTQGKKATTRISEMRANVRESIRDENCCLCIENRRGIDLIGGALLINIYATGVNVMDAFLNYMITS